MNKKQKPDGYVAWKESVGTLGGDYLTIIRSDFEGAIEELLEAAESQPDFILLGEGFSRQERIYFLIKSGWRIRPVKLVFLDEEEK
jgi:hypothetical protein